MIEKMKMVDVKINTKKLKTEIIIEVGNVDKTSIERKLKELIKLTGGEVYICNNCYSVFLTDEPLKKVYNCANDETVYLCEDCCKDMVIVDVEALLNDLKRHNAEFITIY